LIVRGAHDSMIPLPHAQKAIDAAASNDKELVVFDGVDGGSEHCSMDDPDPARQLIADWFADHLGSGNIVRPFTVASMPTVNRTE
jgi:fermentation-respiration switch protein FrsA (DUF1100 family)